MNESDKDNITNEEENVSVNEASDTSVEDNTSAEEAPTEEVVAEEAPTEEVVAEEEVVSTVSLKERTPAQIVSDFEAKQVKTDLPAFRPGDTVIVNVKVKEGDRTRLQAFEGVVISGPRTGSKTLDMAIPKDLPPEVPGVVGTVASVESLRPNASISIKAGGSFNRWMETLVAVSYTHLTLPTTPYV